MNVEMLIILQIFPQIHTKHYINLTQQTYTKKYNSIFMKSIEIVEDVSKKKLIIYS